MHVKDDEKTPHQPISLKKNEKVYPLFDERPVLF